MARKWKKQQQPQIDTIDTPEVAFVRRHMRRDLCGVVCAADVYLRWLRAAGYAPPADPPREWYASRSREMSRFYAACIPYLGNPHRTLRCGKKRRAYVGWSWCD